MLVYAIVNVMKDMYNNNVQNLRRKNWMNYILTVKYPKQEVIEDG